MFRAQGHEIMTHELQEALGMLPAGRKKINGSEVELGEGGVTDSSSEVSAWKTPARPWRLVLVQQNWWVCVQLWARPFVWRSRVSPAHPWTPLPSSPCCGGLVSSPLSSASIGESSPFYQAFGTLIGTVL